MTLNIAELRRLEAEEIQEKVARHLCKLMDDEWRLGRKLYMDTAKEILDDIALPELLKTLEWQPIETAPKDEGWVMLHYRDECVPIISFFSDGAWAHQETMGRNKPTHWMPLPLPPHGGVDVG